MTQPYSFLLHQRRDREQEWRDSVLAVAAYVTVRGILPRPGAAGADADEKRLGQFLSTQRAQANGNKQAHLLTPERRAFLDEHLPGWLLDREQAWRDNVLAVAGYLSEAGMLPSQSSTDAEEKRLGVFLSAQRMQASGHKQAHLLTLERRAFLDKHAPGWLLDREQVWRNSVLMAAECFARHGRFPSKSATDPEEKRLGMFLVAQRRYANGSSHVHLITPERRAFLDKHLPGWLLDHEQAWRNNVLAVAEHFARNGKFPSQVGADPDEKRLAKFLTRQRQQAHGGEQAHLLTPERRAFLDEHLPGWLAVR